MIEQNGGSTKILFCRMHWHESFLSFKCQTRGVEVPYCLRTKYIAKQPSRINIALTKVKHAATVSMTPLCFVNNIGIRATNSQFRTVMHGSSRQPWIPGRI